MPHLPDGVGEAARSCSSETLFRRWSPRIAQRLTHKLTRYRSGKGCPVPSGKSGYWTAFFLALHDLRHESPHLADFNIPI